MLLDGLFPFILILNQIDYRLKLISGRQAALAWYSEISFYNFKKENQINCGHFCQVVWKDTQKAGFGVARSKDGRSIYVVGRYKKPGNYLDYYRDNVPLPLNGKVYVPTDEELTGVAGTRGNGRCRSCNSKLYYYRRKSKKNGDYREEAAQAC
ncbi:unnamed protein product [Hymenolepis diminuta]|uniref:SCP domain-containing protein n=1 Tax=Hymenolepis diminuta TaxID=6216 RepID=A0A0R3SZG8_HYMDI|nr:unnamed protein product [Hymenolepis diminuta]